jgi:hypothetical protein
LALLPLLIIIFYTILMEYLFPTHPPFYQNKQRKQNWARKKFQLIEKENDLIKLEEEYELILDTYEVLKLS